MSFPTADDLFRPTSETAPAQAAPAERAHLAAAPAPKESASRATAGARRSSGRVRHDEKMTVYVTADELLDIEHTRLALRRDHGLAVDRGRLVREALAIALADIEANGEHSALLRRLLAE